MKKKLSKTLQSSGKVKNEGTSDTDVFDGEFPEENYEFIAEEMEFEASSTINWNEAQDRGDDLVNMRDPFVNETM